MLLPTGAGVHLVHQVVRRTEQVGALAGAGVAVAVRADPEAQTLVPEAANLGHQDLARGRGHAQALVLDMSHGVPHALARLHVRLHAGAYRLTKWTPVITDVLSRTGIYTVDNGWRCVTVLYVQLWLERNDLLFPPDTKLLRECFPPLLDPGKVPNLLQGLRTHESAIPIEAIPN